MVLLTEMRKFFNTRILLIVIVVFAFILRMNSLGNIPSGFLNDEADIGYDAYSLLLTGHDQWNTLLPIAGFKGFGDYRPVIYTYLVVPAIKLFGLNEFAVRLPAALFGTLSVVLIFFVTRKLFSEKVGLISAFLLAISPWAVGMSRVGIESTVAVTCTLFALWMFLLRKKHPTYFILSIVFFAVSIYTYAAYTLFVPLVLLLLLLFYKKDILQNKKIALVGLVVFIALIAPFFIHNNAAGTRSSQVGFVHSMDSIGLSTTRNEKIGSCRQGYPNSICKLTDNKFGDFLTVFTKNYLHHFSLDFLYLQGTPTQYSVLPDRGLEFIWEVVFVLFGILMIAREKKKEGFFILCLLLLSVVPDALTGDGHYSRATIMQPFLVMIEGLGCIYLLNYFQKRKIVGIVVIVAGIGVIAYSIFSFWITYTTYFKTHYETYSQYGYKSLMADISQEKQNYSEVYLTSHLHDAKQYVYYLFYSHYDPKVYQAKKDVIYTTQPDGWIAVTQIGTIHFVPKIPDPAILDKKSIIVSDPVDFPKVLQPVFTVKDLEGNVIFEAVKTQDFQQYNLQQRQLPSSKSAI